MFNSVNVFCRVSFLRSYAFKVHPVLEISQMSSVFFYSTSLLHSPSVFFFLLEFSISLFLITLNMLIYLFANEIGILSFSYPQVTILILPTHHSHNFLAASSCYFGNTFPQSTKSPVGHNCHRLGISSKTYAIVSNMPSFTPTSCIQDFDLEEVSK